MPQIYRFGWLVAVITMFGLGFTQKNSASRPRALTDRGSDSGVNTSLAALGARDQVNLSQRIIAWLDCIPTHRPLLIVGAPKNVAAAGTAQLISYLAWPRPVLISCGDLEESAIHLRDFPEKYGAVALCHLTTSAKPENSTDFGPALTLIAPEEISQ